MPILRINAFTKCKAYETWQRGEQTTRLLRLFDGKIPHSYSEHMWMIFMNENNSITIN